MVKKGDTIYSIAREYSVPADLIININSPPDPDRLVVGQTLVIGIPKITHTVKKGETLTSIASDYKTTVKRLLRNNPQLMGSKMVKEGESLVIEYDQEPERCIMTGGYAYPYIDAATLRRTLPGLSSVSPFSYGFTSEGELVTLSDEAILEQAFASGVRPVMVLTSLNSDDVFDNGLAHALLNDEEAKENLYENIVANIALKGYKILDIDFEYLFPEDKKAFENFVAGLREKLDDYGVPVWVALAPKTSDDQKGLLYEAHDYRELGNIADRLLLMTYEWGYTYGPQMPVAPYDKVREVVEYAVSVIEPEKLLLGIPNYGYDFTLPYEEGVSRAKSLSPQQAVDLAFMNKAEIFYDKPSETAYFTYTKDGVKHKVWFDDARSTKAKLELADEFGLAGVSFWNLMQYTPQTWMLLNPYCIAK